MSFLSFLPCHFVKIVFNHPVCTSFRIIFSIFKSIEKKHNNNFNKIHKIPKSVLFLQENFLEITM